MKKILVLLSAVAVILSAVSCSGNTSNDDVENLGDEVVGGVVFEDENNEEPSEEVEEDPVEEEPIEEEPIEEEPIVETPVEEEPIVEEPVEEVVENSFDPSKWSTFGLPEPSFSYTYRYYEEGFVYRDENGEPVFGPKFIYEYDCDLETAYNYMKEMRDAGFGGWVADTVPTLIMGDSTWYTTETDTVKINFNFDTEGEHNYMWITDCTKLCVWNDDLYKFIIEGLEYGTYGSYGMPSN